MKGIVCAALLCLINSVSQAMFCNTSQGTNGWIDIGASEQEVIAACGEPDSKTQVDQPDNKTLNTTQYWNYQQQSVQLMPPKQPGVLTPVNMNSSPNILVAEINGNSIKSLALNGNFVSSGKCPNGGFVRVGDSVDALIARCGPATQTSYQYNTNTTAQASITVWTYQLTNGQLQFQFKEGVVSGIAQ